MIIHLPTLSLLESLKFPPIILVYRGRNRKPVGTCKIFNDEKGEYFARLFLNEEINPELRLQYFFGPYKDGAAQLVGIHFVKMNVNAEDSSQLKELITEGT